MCIRIGALSFVSNKVADGTTVLFWTDTWNGQLLQLKFPELHSFAKDKGISFKKNLSFPNMTAIPRLRPCLVPRANFFALESC